MSLYFTLANMSTPVTSFYILNLELYQFVRIALEYESCNLRPEIEESALALAREREIEIERDGLD